MMKESRIKTLLLGSGVVAASLGLMASSPVQAVVVYEDLPTSLAIPPNISWHNANGPIIADDFVPTSGGAITHVTWWGSAATSDQFEIVLQDNNPLLNEPALTPAGNNVTGGLKQFVNATAVLVNPAIGLWQYDANVASGWNIAGGRDYWFTAANVNNGWEWAEALAGPTVGNELWNAHSSVGPGCLDGGPHCGPWTDVHTDFAFRISAVPEPATWAMLIVGFACMGVAMRTRRRIRMSFV